MRHPSLVAMIATKSPPSPTTTTTSPTSTLKPQPSASQPSSKLVPVYLPCRVTYMRTITAFTTTGSTTSPKELIPATVPSFWSRTTFSPTHRLPCSPQTGGILSSTATISAVPPTMLPLVLSTPSPTPTRCFQPAPSSPTSPPVLVLSSPSEKRYIYASPAHRSRVLAGPDIETNLNHGQFTTNILRGR